MIAWITTQPQQEFKNQMNVWSLIFTSIWGFYLSNLGWALRWMALTQTGFSARYRWTCVTLHASQGCWILAHWFFFEYSHGAFETTVCVVTQNHTQACTWGPALMELQEPVPKWGNVLKEKTTWQQAEHNVRLCYLWRQQQQLLHFHMTWIK